jgi:regulator of cell morphogenesis and NO signaling
MPRRDQDAARIRDLAQELRRERQPDLEDKPMASISQVQTVGELAAMEPAALRVLSRHGIDFCCGGARPIEEACLQAGLTPAALIEQIAREARGPETAAQPRWDQEPLDRLIDHILERYHRKLWAEMPRLRDLARKVEAAHGPKDPERFRLLTQTVDQLCGELEPHMHKEEQILFPWIAAGRGASAGPPIRVMLMEHEAAAELLSRLRLLTDGFQVPEEACATWRALWQGLEDLETELKEHIHLENNILFPRALQS